MRRLLAVAALTVGAMVAPSAAAPAAQVVDPAGDANGGTYWASDPDTVTPAGSQSYADVTAVRFATTKVTKRTGRRPVTTVTGFTVTMSLSAAPVPPADVTGIYRVLGIARGCVLGIDHYTRGLPDAAQPRSAFLDTCGGSLRRTPLGPAVIAGQTVTWTVPLAALPKSLGVGAGTTLTNLHFEVLAAHHLACGPSAAGAEQPPCAVQLDSTFQRGATFVIR